MLAWCMIQLESPQFLLNWESPQTEVKDYEQCMQQQCGSQLHVYHFPNGIRDVILLRVHTFLCFYWRVAFTQFGYQIWVSVFFQDKMYEVDYCSQIFLFKIVNADKMFETKKYFYYGYVYFPLIGRMWNHLPFYHTNIAYTLAATSIFWKKLSL